jgi:hypothetical protein
MQQAQCQRCSRREKRGRTFCEDGRGWQLFQPLLDVLPELLLGLLHGRPARQRRHGVVVKTKSSPHLFGKDTSLGLL